MARFGKLPVEIPEGVTVSLEGREVKVSGPKGEVVRKMPSGVKVEMGEGKLTISRRGETKQALALQGTWRAHIRNMVIGVSEGWKRELELVGAGYRGQLQGKDLVLSIGFSHPVTIEAPEGVEFGIEKSVITISGADLEKVSQVAAKLRAVRPPEPYKGKGIKYIDEVVRRKPGKQAAKAEA